MDWKKLLAYITGSVGQELLLRTSTWRPNRILRDQIKGRLGLTDVERKTLAEIGKRLGKKALTIFRHSVLLCLFMYNKV